MREVGCQNTVVVLQNNKPNNKEQRMRSVMEPLRIDWGYDQTSQEQVSGQPRRTLQDRSLVKLFLTRTTQTYVATVCDFLGPAR